MGGVVCRETGVVEGEGAIACRVIMVVVENAVGFVTVLVLVLVA